ncbi:Glycoside hydrolase superfamily [Penicillium argentinense]|uniref:non-reducing end alpha-L-arabinofuranosidase n=1 Tax=Penicillium argentinense TaxID=1131581 RepID=A0A9W9EZ74_9EURO|nr:Glycoside hydrolase superfamily [Penicillium argentinense]KAJ5090594.1 Glycoside hydrolase superfamily [Penicillium argentinense]
MFEEMDHSGDGGIHGQLLQNNGFQGSSLGMTSYAPVGDVSISRDTSKPVSEAIKSSLSVDVPKNSTEYVGFANTGYNGVPVTKDTYSSSFWMMGDYSGTINLQLIGSNSGIVYADHNLTVNSTRSKFAQFETSFNSTASPDGENEWHLTFDGSKVAGDSLNFGYIQLFPPTYKNRENGLRRDLATIDSRWKWNTTIGPLVDRPGRESDWFYPNTDAVGLDEYLWWCEDMNMTPVLAVWAGKSYGGIVSESDLEPYVDDIMNELEYLLGDSKTKYGKIRAENGREKPWKIEYVEIGNEDDLTGGCDTYPNRFDQIYKAIHKKYPHITLIASNGDSSCLPSPVPRGVILDLHLYRQPDDFVALFNQFDNHPRHQPVMVGEYGCRNTSDAKGTYWSYQQGTCSEAVYMIGMERNSDIVEMAAYAPVLEHFGFISWSPTMYGFNSSPGSITPSTSYFVQQMFASNKGDTVLPVKSSSKFGPLYWVATKSDAECYVKLANYGPDQQNVTVGVPKSKSGRLEMLAGSRLEGNQPYSVTVQTKHSEVEQNQGNYTVLMPPWAVAVLAVQ